MAYKDGVWESDRETRRRNELMWKDHKSKGKGIGIKGRPNYEPEPDLRESDLTRAMASETGTAKPAYTGTLGIGGSGKLDRPLIPGGCSHTGVKLAFVLSNGKRLYGAQAHAIVNPGHLDLIIDCAGLLGPRKKFVAKSTAPRYRSLDTAAWPDILTLTWPDMSAPTHVGIRFWTRLRDMMPEDTAVCCMGGHGRTGTALAALLVADGIDADIAIKRVRAEHCPRAIETTGQETYIRTLARERDHDRDRERERNRKGAK